MINHKLTKNNYKKFKTFTGIEYYEIYFNNTFHKNKRDINGFRYLPRDKSVGIWFPFWVDNYKRLNSLHNKLLVKTKKINRELDNITKDIYSYSETDYNFCFYQNRDKVFDIRIDVYNKTFSWSINTVNYLTEIASNYFCYKTSYIKDEIVIKKLKKTFREYFALLKKFDKYRKYLSMVESVLGNVIKEIISYKNKTEVIVLDGITQETVSFKIDNDVIIAHLKSTGHRPFHENFNITFDFSKNNKQIVL